jgi:hypothetical protein
MPPRQRLRITAPAAHVEAQHRGPEAHGDPGEQQREQQYDALFQQITTVVRQYRQHAVNADQGLADHQQRQHRAAHHRHRLPAASEVGHRFRVAGLAHSESA